jgi:hypothetical protein
MAFICEEIPAAEKTEIDWKRFATWLSSGPAHWTIDRSRNVFLIEVLGGHPDGAPPQYRLYLEGHICTVYARTRLESTESGRVVHWEISGIGVPDDLRQKVQGENWAAFMAIIEEALTALGRWLYKTERVDVI